MNEKNTPTKPPRTPSKSKEYANQNTKDAILIKRLRQPKYQVHHLNEKIRQPKHQVRHLNQKEDLRCFVARQILSRIYALFWRTFFRLKKYVGVPKMTIIRYALPLDL